ncbi:hypothetical protein E5288_WYG009926 [Bos mutus]|uniref:Uncharacterized protein n=1 Tax=Bos mutus TaxID=72004 RepID=A0A6B0S3J4_9CETA|nr:hypothetical protein [Bos mutus]
MARELGLGWRSHCCQAARLSTPLRTTGGSSREVVALGSGDRQDRPLAAAPVFGYGAWEPLWFSEHEEEVVTDPGKADVHCPSQGENLSQTRCSWNNSALGSPELTKAPPEQETVLPSLSKAEPSQEKSLTGQYERARKLTSTLKGTPAHRHPKVSPSPLTPDEATGLL